MNTIILWDISYYTEVPYFAVHEKWENRGGNKGNNPIHHCKENNSTLRDKFT